MSDRHTIALGTDHAGYAYKEAVKAMLIERGCEVHDFGAFDDTSSDYPDFVRPAAEAVAVGFCDGGVVFGGSGNGEAIVANKVVGVRCAVCWSAWTAEMAALHNDANCISIGSRTVTQDEALAIVETWLKTEFEGGRHLRRIEKIESRDATEEID